MLVCHPEGGVTNKLITMAQRTRARGFTMTNHFGQQCVIVNSYNQTCFIQTPVYWLGVGITIECIATARSSCAWVLTMTERFVHFVNSYKQLPCDVKSVLLHLNIERKWHDHLEKNC